MLQMNDNKNPGIKFKQVKKIAPAKAKVSSAACSAAAGDAQNKPPC
jgi:hypothetical protein